MACNKLTYCYYTQCSPKMGITFLDLVQFSSLYMARPLLTGTWILRWDHQRFWTMR